MGAGDAERARGRLVRWRRGREICTTQGYIVELSYGHYCNVPPPTHYSLQQEHTPMLSDIEFAQHVHRIVEQHGPAICLDGARFAGLLEGLSGSEPDPGLEAIIAAVRAGAASTLVRPAVTVPAEARIPWLKEGLVAEHCMPEDAAHGAVDALAKALARVDVPERAEAGGPVAPLIEEPVHGDSRMNPVDGYEMVWVPAGEFLMGSTEKSLASVRRVLEGVEHEHPQHTVQLNGYWIGRYPVTVGQYRVFCAATGREMPEEPPHGWKKTHPMENVCWDDAQAYCLWAHLALPTEAQWEKAARGTDGRRYPWGDDWLPEAAVSSVGAPKPHSTASVGARPAGITPYGCMDMAGNVWEWCADWYDPAYYVDSPHRNPAGAPFGSLRVLRGGSWRWDYRCVFRASHRNCAAPAGGSYGAIGFRAVTPPLLP